jgi:hypothetical protein
MRNPPGQRTFGDSEPGCHLGFRQHSPVSQSVVARTEPVLVNEIRHPQVGEPYIGLATARGAARANPLFVQDVGDLRRDVIVEQFIDKFDHFLWGLDLLCRGFGILCGQRLGLTVALFTLLESGLRAG